ncbi:hypothetical protein ELR50_06595 [Pseudomonas citronellolis]|nr:hypothetical protein ELR50_06595 [Pseudomonas citronellolis]
MSRGGRPPPPPDHPLPGRDGEPLALDVARDGTEDAGGERALAGADLVDGMGDLRRLGGQRSDVQRGKLYGGRGVAGLGLQLRGGGDFGGRQQQAQNRADHLLFSGARCLQVEGDRALLRVVLAHHGAQEFAVVLEDMQAAVVAEELLELQRRAGLLLGSESQQQVFSGAFGNQRIAQGSMLGLLQYVQIARFAHQDLFRRGLACIQGICLYEGVFGHDREIYFAIDQIFHLGTDSQIVTGSTLFPHPAAGANPQASRKVPMPAGRAT